MALRSLCWQARAIQENYWIDLDINLHINLAQIWIKPMLSLIKSLFNQPDTKANVELYSWQTCPYCIRAKLLLRWKGVKFTEYKIDGDGAARIKMAERANGRRSVPQIFINDQHIGGCDDLYALDRQGQLDPLLVQAES